MATVLPPKPSVVVAKKPFYKSKWLWIPVSVVLVLLVVVYFGIGVYGATTLNRDSKRVTSFGDETPAKYGLTYEDVTFASASSDKLTLRGWWIANPNSKQALVLVHGRDADRTKFLPIGKSLWDSGYNLFYFDLRGQGLSDGDRYFFGQYEKYDVLAAFNFVKSKGFNPNSIGVLATSMGAVSTLLALPLSDEIKVVVSESSYADFEKLAQYRFTKDTGMPEFLLPGVFLSAKVLYGLDINQTRPEQAIKTVSNRRIFLIHGELDADVPIDHFTLLQKASGNNIVDSWIVPGGDHDNFKPFNPEYMQKVTTFFKSELAS
jgi:uncharacterized protein